MYTSFFTDLPFFTSDQKAWLKEADVFTHLLIFLSSMFEYKGMGEELNTDFIEYYNILSPMGGAGIFKNESGVEIVGYLSDGGFKNAYGICEEFNINTLNNNKKQHCVDGTNCAIFWNNKTHTNDFILLNKFTEMLNLSDTTQKCLLKYARLFPIFAVQDSNIQKQIETALNNADKGDPVTFTTKGLTKLDANNTAGVEVVNLGNIEAVDKIQYLSTYHNDLLKRFFSMFGMAYSMSTKQAQQSIEEVHSENKISWIIPNDRLEQRKKGIESYNKVFGKNASVEFSQAWKDAYNEFLANGGAGNGKEELQDKQPAALQQPNNAGTDNDITDAVHS